MKERGGKTLRKAIGRGLLEQEKCQETVGETVVSTGANGNGRRTLEINCGPGALKGADNLSDGKGRSSSKRSKTVSEKEKSREEKKRIRYYWFKRRGDERSQQPSNRESRKSVCKTKVPNPADDVKALWLETPETTNSRGGDNAAPTSVKKRGRT